jgi:3-phenylpropionate/trans-cinnamate dioxygenase ferredoxin reductase subunit
VPAGIPGDRVVCRGEVDRGEFIAFWLSEDGRVTAGMNVDVCDVTDSIQALIRSRGRLPPDWLADPGIPLEVLAG